MPFKIRDLEVTFTDLQGCPKVILTLGNPSTYGGYGARLSAHTRSRVRMCADIPCAELKLRSKDTP